MARRLRTLAACASLAAAAFVLLEVEGEWHRRRFHTAIFADLERLRDRQPPGVSRNKWGWVLGWTGNAFSNCLIDHTLSRAERDRFGAEWGERVRGPATLGTIDWVWDELVRLTPGGRLYSDQYRPTRPDRLEMFKEDDGRVVRAGRRPLSFVRQKDPDGTPSRHARFDGG